MFQLHGLVLSYPVHTVVGVCTINAKEKEGIEVGIGEEEQKKEKT
jgi:hypothetical protein